MTFLKKLGQILLKGVEIITGIGPLLSNAYPGMASAVRNVINDLEQVAQVVIQVEAMGAALALTGPQKLQAAVTAATQIILRSSILVGHSIADPEVFKRGVTKIVDGVVDVLNSLKANIDTESKV